MSRVIRLSQDKTHAIVQKEGLYSMIDVNTRQCIGVADSLSKFDSQNVWNYPTSSEKASLLPLVAAGMDRHKRSQKAESQPRDNQGRWVSAGANVRWRANGQEWAGSVDEIRNGKAIVTVRHPDGSVSRTTLLPNTLRVMASKARLGSAAKKYPDNKNNAHGFIGDNFDAIEQSAGTPEGAVIEREDGYSIEAKKRKDKESNAIIYQLYSPTGMSLGIYDDKGVDDFDDIIADDKGSGSPEAPAPEGGEGGEGEAPAPAAPATGVSVVASGNMTPYTVPKAVQTAVLAFMEKNHDDMSPDDIELATELSSGEQVGIEAVQWVDAFFESLRDLIDLYGGYSGGKWAEKVMTKYNEGEPSEYEPIDHDFETGNYQYYASGNEFDDLFDTLLAVDFASDTVHIWDGQRFGDSICSVEEYDALNIEALDDWTAREIAYGIHDQIVEAGKQKQFSINDVFPEERNLFALAEAEMDFNLIDDLAQLAYDGYDRQRNATGQARGEGGKFGAVPEEPTKPKTDKPVVEDTTEAVEQAGSKEGASEEDPLSTAEYFAIVDDVDQAAVLDIVAISNESGKPMAYKRVMGAWTPDAEMLASLKGATPPAIVNLGDVDEIKDVLSQVDEYDGAKEAVTASAARRGYSLADGSFRILNQVELIDAVNAADQLSTVPQEISTHITKRAKALNRIDIVPEEWRITSMVASGDVLYGEFGEIVPTTGAQSFAPNLEKLESYFTKGHGAKKISWGQEGDIQRAQSVFSRHIGVERAYGFAQTLKTKVSGE